MVGSPEHLLKVSEVAKLLSCNINQVYALIYSGRLRGVNLSTGSQKASWRIPQSQYEEFINVIK
jgi:excisionase family DNA binding protein